LNAWTLLNAVLIGSENKERRPYARVWDASQRGWRVYFCSHIIHSTLLIYTHVAVAYNVLLLLLLPYSAAVVANVGHTPYHRYGMMRNIEAIRCLEPIASEKGLVFGGGVGGLVEAAACKEGDVTGELSRWWLAIGYTQQRAGVVRGADTRQGRDDGEEAEVTKESTQFDIS
jgi:hypothetical protein